MALADYLPAHPRNPVAREIARAARRYLKRFNGFSYDFAEGGEKGLLQRLQSLPLKVFFDVGANLGDWSHQASSFFPDACFHTFEISESNFSQLTQALPETRFIHNRMGLSDCESRIRYKDYGSGSGLNTIVTRSCIHDKTCRPDWRAVELTTGEKYCQQRGIDRIDFLKVDVEGAEHLVLAGFAQLLAKGSIRFIQFEYGFANGDSRFLMRDFYDLLGSCGYGLAKVRKRGIEFVDFSYDLNNFDSGPNYLAVAQGDRDARELLGARPS